MSGETQQQESGWTVDTLKAHYDQRFIDQDKAVQAALTAAKEATLKAEDASNKRFDSVNEFRSTLSDQVNTFLPRREYDARHETLEKLVTEISDRINRSEGAKVGSDITIGKIYAAIGVVGAILGIIVLLTNAFFSK